MSALHLSLPNQDLTNGNPETDPKRLEHWLDNLPYLAVVESAREMREGLHKLNRTKLAPGQRLKLMEQFHTAYQRLHESLIDTQLARTGRPEPHEAEQEGKTLRQEMAFAYKLVVSDSAEPKSRFNKNPEVALAVERAIHYLSLFLLQHYQSYDLFDGAYWREITDLYSYAEAKGILQEVVTGTPKTRTTTVENTFKPIAILRISDPYRLPPSTVWDVFYYVGVHKEKIQIQAPQDGAPQAGVLILDMDTDLNGGTESDTAKLWLNCRALIKTLNSTLEDLQAGGRPADAGFSERITCAETIQLGSRLINLWARTPKRVMPRFSGTGTTHLITGLNAIHNQLSDDQIDNDPQTEAISCTRLNRSTGGLALQCAKQDGPGLWVGQITAVGVPSPAGSLRWLPAIVRWLIRTDKDQVNFGVQYIGEKLDPIKVSTTESDSENRKVHTALQLELKHSGKTLQTIIAPNGVFQKGRRLELIHAQETTSIRCGQILESLATMERFSYRMEQA